MAQRQSFPVTTQGAFSRDLLAAARQAAVAGVSSRGVFLHLDSDWVLFLSFERFRGPLTLNLAGNPQLKDTGAGAEAEILEGVIDFPTAGVQVDFRRARAWETPPRLEDFLPAGERLGRLTAVSRLVPPAPFLQAHHPEILHLLKTSGASEIFTALQPLLGAGPGLTPSGDDLILGLLLAYRRWKSALQPAFDLETLGAALVQAAAQKTTRISANLIDCASRGMADERLISALDGIMTGSQGPDVCARHLSAWGSSSGGDSLAGIELAILSTPA